MFLGDASLMLFIAEFTEMPLLELFRGFPTIILPRITDFYE